MSTIPLTVAGAEALRKELHDMKTIHRPAVIAAIAEARAHGDLSENAEYDAAKENKGLLKDVSPNWKVNFLVRRSLIRLSSMRMVLVFLAPQLNWRICKIAKW